MTGNRDRPRKIVEGEVDVDSESVVDVPSILDSWTFEPSISMGNVCGLEEVKQKCRLVVNGVQSPHPPRANVIVLRGKEQVSKRRVAEATAHELSCDGYTCYRVNLADDIERLSRCGIDIVTKLFDEIRCREPCVVVFEQIDDYPGSLMQNLGTYLHELRSSHPQIAVVCTVGTSVQYRRRRQHQPEEAFSWADIMASIPLPNDARREIVLKTKLERMTEKYDITCDQPELDIEAIATRTDEFSLKLLDRVVERATQLASVRTTTESRLEQTHLERATEQVQDEWHYSEDNSGRGPFRSAESVEERAKVEVPSVSFDDVGGLAEQKHRIKECLLYPREYASLYEGAGFETIHGLLLYGPPGTGKTMLAKATANETGRTFLGVRGPELKSMWYGQTEKHIRELFEVANENAPSVLYFDEFDVIAGNRDRSHEATQSAVATLLTEMDGLEECRDVLVMAATNRRETIDDAMLRPGRLGESIEVPLPDETGREEIFALHTEGVPLAEDVTPAWFSATARADLSGAHIAGVAKAGLECAIRAARAGERDEVVVTCEDIRAAIERVTDEADTTSTRSTFA